MIKFLGDNDEEGTPVPIPNTAVKLFDAENTQWVTTWEDRKLPRILYISPCQLSRQSIRLLTEGSLVQVQHKEPEEVQKMYLFFVVQENV